MRIIYGLMSVTELSSGHDPIRALKLALTAAELLADTTFDPSHPTLWPRAALRGVHNTPVDAVNQQTQDHVPARLCDLEMLP